MAAIAERAIHSQLTGLGRERFQNFRDHDGPMRAGGRFAGRDDFRDGVGVTLRIALLVFLLEPARMFAGITRAPAMRRRGRGTVREWQGGVAHSALDCLFKPDIVK